MDAIVGARVSSPAAVPIAKPAAGPTMTAIPVHVPRR